jgi:hypothetical protein
MSIAAELLQRHIQTLVDDHQQWQRLIADNILWELAYAPAIGQTAKLSGRDEVLRSRAATRCFITLDGSWGRSKTFASSIQRSTSLQTRKPPWHKSRPKL